MSHRQRLARTIYFRRLVSIHRATHQRSNRAGLHVLRVLFDRASAMAIARN